MKATTVEATQAQANLESSLAEAISTPCDWDDVDRVLVLDNGRMLHARPPVPNNDEARRLERVLCEPPNGLGF